MKVHVSMAQGLLHTRGLGFSFGPSALVLQPWSSSCGPSASVLQQWSFKSCFSNPWPCCLGPLAVVSSLVPPAWVIQLWSFSLGPSTFFLLPWPFSCGPLALVLQLGSSCIGPLALGGPSDLVGLVGLVDPLALVLESIVMQRWPLSLDLSALFPRVWSLSFGPPALAL